MADAEIEADAAALEVVLYGFTGAIASENDGFGTPSTEESAACERVRGIIDRMRAPAKVVAQVAAGQPPAARESSYYARRESEVL